MLWWLALSSERRGFLTDVGSCAESAVNVVNNKGEEVDNIFIIFYVAFCENCGRLKDRKDMAPVLTNIVV